ncbi:multiple epidermal growth factor-like domains protein 9 isoform X1 [Polyodon spathula]|uniref:multiple epidermal growth factor-like domains protein 9 isoform X1 n=1 Tax=Polyodon spathula TaxID=7913 RepID=UPI001B7DD419|nr:multiple epidermal growth factor-like domains protein 9 isoform X1 [Polyodon spathula]
MKNIPTIMLIFPALEVLLVLCPGLFEAVPFGNASAPAGTDHNVAVTSLMDMLNITATIDNSLPEGGLTLLKTVAPTPVSTSATTTAQPTRIDMATPTKTTATGATQTPLPPPRTMETKTEATATQATTTTNMVETTSSTSKELSTTILSTAGTVAAATLMTTGSATAAMPFNRTGTPPATDFTVQPGSQADYTCNCSSTGSPSLDQCNETTGQCECYPGYTGLQCTDCEEGYFTNGTGEVCMPCGCDTTGALHSLCDSSGICTCKKGVYGSKCDECQPGYFRFSDTGCQPCQCNNHSSSCLPQSGTCLNCQGSTEGHLCEKCKYNFYRPSAALTDSCEPCPCSTVMSTGSCHIDTNGQPVCDQCLLQYRGPHCDKCKDGYYNSDSICMLCECNGNEDPRTSPRICDPDTGQCLNCSNNTAGKHCEKCVEGYGGEDCSKNLIPTTVPPTTQTPTTLSTTTMSTVTTTNLTTLLTSPTTHAVLPTLTSASENATVSEVSWTQFNIIILAVIIVLVAVLMGFVGGVYMYREYQNRKLNAPFWTIELKEDNISFSSYHDSIPNADLSGLLEDQANEVAPNGQLSLSTPINMYNA